MIETVEVLLSTYNGERYLSQLLASVRAQEHPHVRLSVRDDGSSDGTVGLIEQFVSDRPSDRLSVGANLGAARSFMTLLRAVSTDAGYAAFCDQDDVWLPGKLSSAVEALQDVEGPALYCGAVRLVSESLSELKVHRRCLRGASFANALVENIATGCTIVLNRPAIDLLASRTPQRFVMHDAWCYLVVAGCGRVVYDPQPYVLYRLHGTNAVGVGPTLWAEWSGRAARQVREGRARLLTSQAGELSRLYGPQLRPDAARCLEEFLGARSPLASRLRYAVRGSAYRQRRIDDLIFRSLYALHWI
jgi:glycosyltransferase involved in cell wall biosynthesis